MGEKGTERMIPLGSLSGEEPFKTGRDGSMDGVWIGIETLSAAAVFLPAVGQTLVGICASLT